MDPIIGGALLMGGAGLLGAGGNIGAGFAQDSTVPSGDLVGVSSNPYANPLFSGLEFDAATGLGFGDATRIAGPLRDVANQLQALPIENRVKRRAAIGLAAIARYPDLDPEEALQRFADERPTGLGAGRGEILRATLNTMNRLGFDRQSLQDLGRREAAFTAQQQQLIDSGFGGLQTDIILDRARMAQQMGQLGIQASDYATGGAVSPLMQNFIDRRSRAIDRDEETALLRAANTGQRPGTIERDFADLRANTEMAAFADTIQAAAGLQQLFSGQRAPAERTTNMGLQAQSNALNTAANQANVANQIAAQGAMAEGAAQATGIAQGVGGFADALGGIGQLQMLSGLGAFDKAPATDYQNYQPADLSGFGNFSQYARPPGYISTGGR